MEVLLRFDPNLRWLFTELPMLDRYEAAATAGFRGVEVAFPYDQSAAELAKRLKDNDLRLVQILTPFDWDGGERGIACNPDRTPEFRSGFLRTVEYALAVGKPLIHIMAGNIVPAISKERCHETFVSNIAFASNIAGQEELTIILEPCCRARLPNYLYHSLHEAAQVMDLVKSPHVKICFDTYHVQTEEGGDLTERLRENFHRIGHIQVGDVPGRREPSSGDIDFANFFQELEHLKWEGWVGCEYTPSTTTKETLGWARRFGIGAHQGPAQNIT